MNVSAKKRAPNFSGTEKTVLLNIIFNYKTIIENKKTYGVTWRQKDEAWKKIAAIFNSQMPESYPRSKESLKNFYENIKKHVRKEVATEKQEIIKTGGGRPDVKPGRDPTVELALGIMNQKTVYGLENKFDSDCILDEGVEGSSVTLGKSDLKSGDELLILDKLNVEHAYSMVEINNDEFELDDLDTLHDVTPIVPRNEQVLADLEIQTEKRPPALTPKKIRDFSVSKLRQPPTSELKHTWTKRRRPAIQQLTSTQLADEYSKLAKIKQDLYEAEKANILRRRQREEEIFELQKRKLQLDIEFKEMEIRKFRASV